jgi:hypothetical protein
MIGYEKKSFSFLYIKIARKKKRRVRNSDSICVLNTPLYFPLTTKEKNKKPLEEQEERREKKEEKKTCYGSVLHTNIHK